MLRDKHRSVRKLQQSGGISLLQLSSLISADKRSRHRRSATLAGLFPSSSDVLDDVIFHQAVQCIVSVSIFWTLFRVYNFRGSDLAANISVWSACCCVQTSTAFMWTLVLCHCCCIWRLCLLHTCCHLLHDKPKTENYFSKLYICLLLMSHDTKTFNERIQQTTWSDTSSLSLGDMFTHYQEHTESSARSCLFTWKVFLLLGLCHTCT